MTPIFFAEPVTMLPKADRRRGYKTGFRTLRRQLLCYHAISPDWPAVLSVTPECFAAQLEWLARRAYRGVTFSEAAEAGPDARVVAVTFDDAFSSVLELGAPILDRLGWPATVFVPTAFPDSGGPLRWDGVDHWIGGPHDHEMRCMTWSDLRGLADRGWEIGSHTCTHPHLTQLGPDELREELQASRTACEAGMGRPCRTLAYPYGDHDSRVIEATREAGYDYAASIDALLPETEPLALPRAGIYHGDTAWRWRLKLSPFVTRVRRLVSGGGAGAPDATREPARSEGAR